MHLSMAIHTGITRGEGVGLITKVSITAVAIGGVALLA